MEKHLLKNEKDLKACISDMGKYSGMLPYKY